MPIPVIPDALRCIRGDEDGEAGASQSFGQVGAHSLA